MRRIFPMRFLMSSLLLVSVAMAFGSSGVAVDKSLALYYSFDEEDPQAVKDHSQYGNDGVIEGKPEYVEGRIGSALQFDGTIKVQAEHNDALNLTGAHTIAYWLKWDGTGASWSPFISKILIEDGVVKDNYHTWVGSDQIWDYYNAPHGYANAGTPIQLNNEWVHLAITHDGKEKISFHVNGELDNEGKLPTTKACEECPFRVGEDGGGNRGAGALDELAIFNREFNADEIKELMAEGSKPFVAVDYAIKLTDTWGGIKIRHQLPPL
jgi:concanavalin A-like lectin/glucanase superfamily protein